MIQLNICSGLCCVRSGSLELMTELRNAIAQNGLAEKIRIITTPCKGLCHLSPVFEVFPERITYCRILPEYVEKIVNEHFFGGRPVKEFMYFHGRQRDVIPLMRDVGFYANQLLLTLRNRGAINPDNIDEYIALDGYFAMRKALTGMLPDEIIKEVKVSGLRGRGGGGFLTGLKWELTRKSEGNIKYAVCNADEGDPGAFMDRSILESDPHAVLEGMCIAGRAIGASQGYIYIRAEYPLAVKKLEKAIEQAREYGFLGKNIFNSGFNFNIDLYMGAGAFVCGEETALLTSIQGKRGMPRPRPPFPAVAGLWGKPTVLNNVETYANVPRIILRGGSWFASIGTEKSKGSKVFALSGAVKNIGLVEVPMGIPLRDIIFDIGGGIKNQRKFKAVQIGGPSGGCIPEGLLDTPVDYESILGTGAIMGSGGMVVIDDTACMVDVARFFLGFTTDESCGKCIPCRVGMKVMLRKIEDICCGEGQEGDLEILEELCHTVKNSSLCGLGQAAPNPVLTTIRYFRGEYESHIRDKECVASVCKRLTPPPCQKACPIGQEASSYVAYIAHGKYREALEIILKDNPFPSVCGRLCPHPCEKDCRRGREVDSPVSIRYLKRFAAENASIRTFERAEERIDKKVAIVGAGAAGLSAAADLARFGYQVVVYEKGAEPGGMLTRCIPEFILPKEKVFEEIDRILSLGIGLKLNTEIDVNIKLGDLKGMGFDAVLLATGVGASRLPDIPGIGSRGVMDVLSWLAQVKGGVGERVVGGNCGYVTILGNGRAALTAARAALRAGALEVNLIHEVLREETPLDLKELEVAEGEGVNVHYLTRPVQVNEKQGRVDSVVVCELAVKGMDGTGRKRLEVVPERVRTIKSDLVVVAIQFEPDLKRFEEVGGIYATSAGGICVEPTTLSLPGDGVFAAGSIMSCTNSIVEVIGLGKRAAASIHSYLTGGKFRFKIPCSRPLQNIEPVEITGEAENYPRAEPGILIPEALEMHGKESILTLSEDMAIKEARRCLRCDL